MFIRDSIGGDIAYAMEVRCVPESEKRTAQLLERFRLTEFRERDGRLLSGGQMRRASLAIGIALNPGILLLDEPTANLDIATRKEIMRTLDELKSIMETVVFPGMETDIAEGGHILSIGPMEAIRDLNRRLGPYKEKGSFLPFAELVKLFDEYPLLVGAGHPFRNGSHVPELQTRFDFLDLNGKDIAQDRQKTEEKPMSWDVFKVEVSWIRKLVILFFMRRNAALCNGRKRSFQKTETGGTAAFAATGKMQKEPM